MAQRNQGGEASDQGGVDIFQQPGGGEMTSVTTPEIPTFDGHGLYEIVETYAGFGDHLTGTDADQLTAEWAAAMLDHLGATVETPTFEFERYVCLATLRSSGQSVPSVPVFYSGYGRWETSNVQVIELDRAVAGSATSLDSLITGSAGNRALALALRGPDDQPVHCNRVPASYGVPTGPGQPAIIIPGNWAERVRSDAQLSFDGQLETGTGRNVVATLGSPDHRRVNITTPLTGWTPCAGERGTGLAVALAMAADLANDHYVVFVGGGGHELDHLGIRNYLSSNNVSGQPTIHLGASVAAVEATLDGGTRLGSNRKVLTSSSGPIRPGIAERAAVGNWSLLDTEDWPGEGGTWKEAGASVLSMLGSFEHFHLSSDVPMLATTPDALQTACGAAINMARYFLDGGRPSP